MKKNNSFSGLNLLNCSKSNKISKISKLDTGNIFTTLAKKVYTAWGMSLKANPEILYYILIYL